MKKVQIPIENSFLNSTLFYPENVKEKNPAMIFVHGWSSDETGYAPRAEAVTKLGFICLTFDMRGHGQSRGDLNVLSAKDHLADILAAYDFLATQDGVDPDKIVAFGASYGGMLTTLLTSKREVWLLCVRAPAIYHNNDFTKVTKKLVEEREEVFFQNFLPEKNNMILSAIRNFQNNILIIESEHDQIIPHSIIQLYADSVKNRENMRLEVIHNADHQLSDPSYKQALILYLCQWVQNYIKP